ncbi:MAG: hypothetical protein NDI94_01945 [Candidatus Woesearchaeota archaeon]|nr:hypothetical protein [Candidatus Woesearchaeota archaeon]
MSEPCLFEEGLKIILGLEESISIYKIECTRFPRYLEVQLGLLSDAGISYKQLYEYIPPGYASIQNHHKVNRVEIIPPIADRTGIFLVTDHDLWLGKTLYCATISLLNQDVRLEQIYYFGDYKYTRVLDSATKLLNLPDFEREIHKRTPLNEFW